MSIIENILNKHSFKMKYPKLRGCTKYKLILVDNKLSSFTIVY